MLHTIEIDPEKEARIRRYVAAAGLTEQVQLHIGAALDVLPGLVEEVWDLVFIDADKRNNDAYFEAVIEQVRPGGLLIVDNVLWGGKVLPTHELKAGDKDTPAGARLQRQDGPRPAGRAGVSALARRPAAAAQEVSPVPAWLDGEPWRTKCRQDEFLLLFTSSMRHFIFLFLLLLGCLARPGPRPR